MATREKTLFVLGILFVILILLALLIVQSAFHNRSKNTDVSIITTSADPLVSKKITERDFLPEDKPLVTFIDPKRGAESAAVVIVEFSDFSCPFCRSVQSTLDQILSTYPNEIMHVWKDAPNEALYIESFNAHSAARCAQKQQRFWEYHDALFENQETLSRITYRSIAATVGLDTSAWQTCFDEEEERAKVERGLIEAEILGVDGTPYFFINDTRISGAVTFEELNLHIIEELQKQES